MSALASGKGLHDTVSTLQDVIKSQQVKGQEHEPTPTEYFAVISTMIAVGSGGDRLTELLKVLNAVIPSSSKAIIRSQFKSLSQSLLNILKAQIENTVLVQAALQTLGAIMQQQEHSDGFWNALHSLQCINAVLSFLDSDSPKIRKTSHEILMQLMRAHQLSKSASVRGYVADFCVGVILSCSRAAYKRTHCVVLFLESALVFVPEEKLLSILEFSLRLQLCEIPKLTAAVYRMYDTTFQSPYYGFSTGMTIQGLQLLLSSKPATADMESNTYFCTALASAVLCLRKQDRIALLTGSPAVFGATTVQVGPQGNVLNKAAAALIAMCESEFVQVHCAVSTALKRIICTVFERRTSTMISAALQNGTAAVEETQLQTLLLSIAGLFQLKYQSAWLYLLDTMRSLFDLFKHNGRSVKMLAKVIASLAEVYQAIEHGVLLNIAANVHMALTETIGSAVRACGLKLFLEIVPITDSTGLIPTSKEWVINVLHSNLKHMPCLLADFGNCILPIANSYYKLIKGGGGGSANPVETKLQRARVSQLWSLLPEMCAYNVKDLTETFSKLSAIMERLFSDADFPELLTYVVGALSQLARGVRERCPRTPAAAGTEVVTPELTILRASATKFLPLVLQYIEGVSIGESKFQEGVQCIAAWCEIAPAGLVTAVSKKLLQLVLTTTASGGASDSRENVAAAGWMAVMLAIIPLLPENLVQLLFKSIRPLLTASDASSVQKRAYSLLLALLSEHREVVLAMEPPLQMLKAVSEALLTCHVSSRSMRLQCVCSLMTSMTEADLTEALGIISKEVLICQKDANKKTRDGAMEILKLFIAKLQPEVVLQALTTSLSASAGSSTNASSVLKSSIVTALCLLLLNQRSNPTMLNAGIQLLPQVGELLVDDCPHQTKAVLSYLRVFVSIQPAEVVANDEILPGVVAAFTVSLGSHKAKFASRCRAIMRKLTHRIGEDLLRTVVPASDLPLLDYVCKHARRAKRRKDLLKEQLLSSQEERMLGSDSDTDDSDDEMDEDEGTEAPASSTVRDIARNLTSAGSASNQEDYRLGKRPKAMRVGDGGRQSALPSTLDDLLEDQPSARQSGRSTSHTAGTKRGRGDADQDSGSSGRALRKESTRRDEDDHYSVVVGSDGRVVVKEIEPVEEEAAPAMASKTSKRAAEDADADTSKQATKAEGPQKRRKLNLKEPGEEYRAKKAGGDVWKKGMLAPHAFIPLDPRLLSKKHRVQAIDHFGVVVKGGKSKRAGGKTKGTGEGHSGSGFVRNKPKQKRHK